MHQSEPNLSDARAPTLRLAAIDSIAATRYVDGQAAHQHRAAVIESCCIGRSMWRAQRENRIGTSILRQAIMALFPLTMVLILGVNARTWWQEQSHAV